MAFPFALRRRREPELIDQPDLEESLHRDALRGLERINRWSGSAGILWRPIRALAQQNGAPLRLLDVATGAGDVPLRLWYKARRAGLSLEVAGCDRSPRAVAHAGHRAAQVGAAVRFFECDALSDTLPDDYDLVTCSLFLHHLDEGPAVELLRRMGHAARRLVLVNDLRRSRSGLLLAYLGTRLLSASPVVHRDGPLSVAAAYTPAEALDLAQRAGLTGARVARRWPCRYLLSWKADGHGQV
jgi:2-polyprenyl-3-methyl-5-hydroxy-6-metoxy-1,4-benzoquinol methylase